jgi:hypothetical protein
MNPRQKFPPRGAFCRSVTTLMVVALLFPALAWAEDAAPTASPASWQLGLRTTGYYYQEEDLAGNSTDRMLSYQHFSGSASGLAGGHLVFRGSGRFASGLAYDETGIEKSRLYSGFLEARPSPLFKARLGRQFIQSGVTGLTLDGAWMSLRNGPGLEATAWGGARSPYQHGFEIGDTDQDTAVGGRIALRPNRKWNLAGSVAYRERLGMVAERPVGLEVRTSALKRTRLLGRAAYDLEQDRWAKVQLQAMWRASSASPALTVQYLDRHPSIDAASWYSRFTGLERIRVARASLRHTLPSRFGGEVEYLGSFVGERAASRIGLAVLFPLGRVGYSIQMGDAGESNRFYGEIRHQATPWLEVDAQAAVLTYALLENAPADEERDLVTLAAGLRATLRQGCRVVAQVQSLDNPFYSKDVRVLVGLDLSMARGASNFGLGQGGWLQ